MSEINANQYNTINYGGVVVTGNINSLTLVVKPEEEETCTCEEKITRDAEETAAVEKNINSTKQETKEMSVRETLYNLVQEAKEIFGSTPRDILKPYLVAVNMGLIPAMNVNAFNNYFGTNINKTTYCEGTSRDAIHKYAKDELDYYFAKLERFKTSVL